MARPAGIWWRESHNCFYCTHKGRKVRLNPDKKIATLLFYELQEPGELSWNGRAVDLLDEFLDWSRVNHKPSTYKWQKHAVNGFAQSLPAGVRVRDLKPFHLTKWLDEDYPRQPKEDGTLPVTDNTRHGMVSGVMRAFNWAVKEGIIKESPFRMVTKPPKTPRAAYFLPDQWNTLLAQVQDEPFRDFLLALRHTGCRPSEARMVEAKHFHSAQSCWIIPRKLAKGGQDERCILLDDTALAICNRLAEKHPEGALFRNRRGRAWTKDAINSRFQRLKHKLPFHATAYVCRHTFITDALVNGVGEATVSELAGHRDKRMVLTVYQHVSKRPDHLRESLKKATEGLN